MNQNDLEYSKNKDYDKNISIKDTQIEELNSELTEKDIVLSRTKSYLFDLEYDLNCMNNKIKSLESELISREKELHFKENQINEINSKLSAKNNYIENMEFVLFSNKKEIDNLTIDSIFLKREIKKKNIQLKDYIKDIEHQKNLLKKIEDKYHNQLSDLDSKEYCIHCYKEQIQENNFEIDYIKKNSLLKKIINPFSYLYLLFKSNPNEISLNFKLYRLLKRNKCFNIGFYLNNNKDIIESGWCKYFSPELHYVCNGFNEKRKFNKKYFNIGSKKELLDYLLKGK